MSRVADFRVVMADGEDFAFDMSREGLNGSVDEVTSVLTERLRARRRSALEAVGIASAQAQSRRGSRAAGTSTPAAD
jgi:hypothetical protein